jgi:hypothetical protein
MAPTFIQTNSASANSVTSLSSAFPSNNTIDNFLVAVFRLPFGSGNTYTVFDSQGNNWVNFVNFAQSSDRYQLWYAPGCKGGGNTVTVQTVPQASSFFRIIIAEYSGVVSQAQSVTDGQTSAIGNSTAVSSGGLTTVNASDLLIGFTSNQDADGGNGTFTVTGAGAPYTSGGGWNFRRQQDTNLNLYDMNVSSTGTYTFTGTDAGVVHWGAGIAAFKASSTGFTYEGYGINDCGGQALPAQEPSSTVFATQTNSTNQLTPSGGKGPTNVGVFYQSGGGGTTPGDGQIFPTGRS